MALTLTDTTYAGEAASGFIVKAFTGCQTVQGGHIYVKDGIKKQFTIPRMTVDGIIQDRAATPTSAGTIDVTGRALAPADFMVYNEFNPRTFEDHWIATQLDGNLLDRRLPASAESVVLQEHLKVAARWFDNLIWRGDTAANSSTKLHYFDGILKKHTTGATNIVASPVALTAGNIVSKMEATLDLVRTNAPALLFDPSLKFFVNYKTAELYRQAQQAQTTKGVDFTQGAVRLFNGYQVIPIAAMPDDTIYVARANATMESNLWLGMDSTMTGEGEPSSVMLAKLQANSELFFVKMLMKLDVQIGWLEEAFMYKV